MGRGNDFQRNGITCSRPSRYGRPSHRDLAGAGGHSARAKTEFDCSNCPEQFKDLEVMAVHLQRHLDVKGPIFTIRGKKRSIKCPKGCGRHFPCQPKHKPKAEDQYHMEICDGSAPLVGRTTKEEEE